MSTRVRRARELGSAVIGLVLIAAAPILGWYVLGFFVLSAANLQTLDWRLERARRPDRVIACSLLWTTLVIGAAAATTGGPTSPLLPWMVIPAALAAGRFRPRVVLVGAALTILMMLVATLAVDPNGTLHRPVLLLASTALLVNLVATVSAVTAAEIEHRAEAATDALTGLLNRNALDIRFAELAHQARISGSAVVMIVCDLDHFKKVNDTYGHERGDRVLRDAASAMRTALRTFELLYRFGGEEFMIVLPGSTLTEGTEDRRARPDRRRRMPPRRPGRDPIRRGQRSCRRGSRPHDPLQGRRQRPLRRQARRTQPHRLRQHPAHIEPQQTANR